MTVPTWRFILLLFHGREVSPVAGSGLRTTFDSIKDKRQERSNFRNGGQRSTGGGRSGFVWSAARGCTIIMGVRRTWMHHHHGGASYVDAPSSWGCVARGCTIIMGVRRTWMHHHHGGASCVHVWWAERTQDNHACCFHLGSTGTAHCKVPSRAPWGAGAWVPTVDGGRRR